MTEEQRRYMHARQRVEATLVNPVTELLAATSALLVAERRKGFEAAWKVRGGYIEGLPACLEHEWEKFCDK